MLGGLTSPAAFLGPLEFAFRPLTRGSGRSSAGIKQGPSAANIHAVLPASSFRKSSRPRSSAASREEQVAGFTCLSRTCPNRRQPLQVGRGNICFARPPPVAGPRMASTEATPAPARGAAGVSGRDGCRSTDLSDEAHFGGIMLEYDAVILPLPERD